MIIDHSYSRQASFATLPRDGPARAWPSIRLRPFVTFSRLVWNHSQGFSTWSGQEFSKTDCHFESFGRRRPGQGPNARHITCSLSESFRREHCVSHHKSPFSSFGVH